MDDSHIQSNKWALYNMCTFRGPGPVKSCYWELEMALQLCQSQEIVPGKGQKSVAKSIFFLL